MYLKKCITIFFMLFANTFYGLLGSYYTIFLSVTIISVSDYAILTPKFLL